MAFILFDDDPFPFHGKRKMKTGKTFCWTCSVNVEKTLCALYKHPAPHLWLLRDAEGSWCLQGLQKACDVKSRALNAFTDFTFESSVLQ